MPTGTWTSKGTRLSSTDPVRLGSRSTQPLRQAVVVHHHRPPAVGAADLRPDVEHGEIRRHLGRVEEVVGLDRRDGQPSDPPVGAHEVGHERRRRPPEDLARCVVLLEHAALGQDRDPVTQLGGLLDVVGDEHDGLLELLPAGRGTAAGGVAG